MSLTIPDFQTTEGDTFDLPATLNDSQGTAFSLADCTVTFTLMDAADNTPVLDGVSVSVEDATARAVRVRVLTPPAGMIPGLYHGRFTVDFPDGSRTTFPRPTPLLIEVAA